MTHLPSLRFVQRSACVLALLVTAACASTPVAPARQFNDIPIPDGLELQRAPKSHWVTSDTYRYGVLAYEGECAAVDVESFLRESMPRFNWRLTEESGTDTSKVLTFRRNPDTAQCVIEPVGESNSRLTITVDTVTTTESSETPR